MTEEELGFWLARFVNEVRNAKGDYYPPKSLHNLLCGVQRLFHSRSDGTYKDVHIFDKANIHFALFWNNCDSIMKMLTEKGYGQNVNQADVITDTDEDTLWSTDTINLHTAQGLLYGVYFYNVKIFSLRGRAIHRKLCKEQFEVKLNTEVGVETLYYYERLSKNNQAGLKHLKVAPLKREIFAQPDNPRCVVNLFQKY